MFPSWSFLKGRLFDERFVLHRYESTSHAGVIAAATMGTWLLHDLPVHGRLRRDFLIVLVVMAAAKIGFMIWYRLRD